MAGGQPSGSKWRTEISTVDSMHVQWNRDLVHGRGFVERHSVETAARDEEGLFGTIGPLLEGVLAHKAVGEIYIKRTGN
jgi:hypothetical protein